jgi:DNA topoisomerase-1
MVIEFLLKQFDPLFVYEYTENMEKELDEISKGNSRWQDLCLECNNTMNSLTNEIKDNKAHIKIDNNHVYMIGKYGPVIKKEKDGETTFINVKKDIDIDKLKRGGYKLSELICERKIVNGRNLGQIDNNDVILKNGKFGFYISFNGKNFSLKGMKKSFEEITLEDVKDIVSGKKSANPKILLILNDHLSIRMGKYGPYVFYKTEKMKKPRFFAMYQVFKTKKGDEIPNWKTWKNSPNHLIRLIKDNCLTV